MALGEINFYDPYGAWKGYDTSALPFRGLEREISRAVIGDKICAVDSHGRITACQIETDGGAKTGTYGALGNCLYTQEEPPAGHVWVYNTDGTCGRRAVPINSTDTTKTKEQQTSKQLPGWVGPAALIFFIFALIKS